MPKLEINDLHVSVGNKKILNGVNLDIDCTKTIALLGPNGNGKSTLLQTIMGNPNYVINSGSIKFDNVDITNLPVDQKSKLGIFLGMQYPSEVPGVNNVDFLKTAINARREKPVSLFEFYKTLDAAYEKVKIPFEMSNRNLNEGFSGGEKKKNEILQMLVLDPKFVMLDEIDSGLDVDAIQTVSEVIKTEQSKRGFLIISHYARLYDLINVDEVYVLVNGKIALSGKKDLIAKIDNQGYEWIKNEYEIEFKNDENLNHISLETCVTKEALKKSK